MLTSFAVKDYRSLRDVRIPLEQLNVITGPNGSGKSSLYRALQLLAAAGQGRLIGALAGEGGLGSTLWAGPEKISAAVRRGDHPLQGTTRNELTALKLGFSSEDFGYAIDLGLPRPGRSKFYRDPEIKAEAVWVGQVLRRANTLAQRNGALVTVMGRDGDRASIKTDLAPYDSMLTHAASASDTPELFHLRERMRGWRFYDQLRTDKNALSRRPHIGTRTFALADDGSDLAAAIQTILEIGDHQGLIDAIDDAFPESHVEVQENDGLFELVLHQKGMLRPLRMAELSDGTLRFILLTAALLTPRPPELVVLNEPETSLHVDLLPALGRLILKASQESQVIVVSHARPLVDMLCAHEGQLISLYKDFGETIIEGVDPVTFNWPTR